MKRKPLVITLSVVGALALIGIVGNALGLGGGADAEAAPTAQPTTIATGPTTKTSAPPAAEEEPEPTRCLAVAESAKAAISEGLQGGITLDSWAAVRSEDREAVWFVSAKGSGGFLQDGDVLTFATGYDPTIEGGALGLTVSADGFAQQATTWPYGPDSALGVSFVEDGGPESRECAAEGF
ncbi:hypothetical protein [Microbacterium sp. XT11]|uniref:hypothetical protein n=1 Tax=Microbacterium sp. XT11 TaxID=367477 RepID=UPI00082A5B0B|nr:hypothetical protein [Microbacterium sp. XT11]